MSILFDEKTYKALREQVRRELEPMTKVMFEYHLKKFEKDINQKQKENRKMPGNTIKINKKLELEWYLGDSKMAELIHWLNHHGVKNEPPENKIKMLEIWVEQMIQPYDISKFVKDVEGSNDPNVERKWKFNLYTQKHLYRITAIDRKKNDGYLGCTFSCRMPRAGEDCKRGGDLPDGKFTEETWKRIKNSILRNEFEELIKSSPPISDRPILEEYENINFCGSGEDDGCSCCSEKGEELC